MCTKKNRDCIQVTVIIDKIKYIYHFLSEQQK